MLQSDKKQISPKEKFIIAKQQDSDRKPHEKYMKMMQMRQKMRESVWMKNKEMHDWTPFRDTNMLTECELIW